MPAWKSGDRRALVSGDLPLLFNILDLLADRFKLALDFHDDLGDGNVARLRADGVGLAVDLLKQEIELSADGLIGGNDLFKRFEMRGKTDELFVDGNLIRKECTFRDQTAFVDRNV